MPQGQETIAGGCNCGAIRYTIAGAPLGVAGCHCTRCRRQSGAAFSINLLVRAADMTVEGALASFEEHDTASGVPMLRQYCGACGSPIRSAPGSAPKFVAVKAGTLDEPGSYAPQMHIWTRSKLPWVDLPTGIPAFAEDPQR